MPAATLILDPAFRVGPIDPRLYGTFVEHLGRSVYEGIYEPGHPTADENGFRGDVLDLTRELGASIVRYPGGNFVSAYNWEDGIGPVADRPVRQDLAWLTTEPNTFGLNEFAAWCATAGIEPMMAVNLGTRGVDAARNLVEYCNHPSGTYWSDLRVAHGQEKPHGVKVWCLGNEMDGPWQVGATSAGEYGRLAAQTAIAMRRADPSIELVACGSSNSAMPTFAAWEAEVLEHTYEHVDYISLHSYYFMRDRDLGGFLASATDMDAFIESVIATCDYVKAKRRSTKTISLSFDEWNVWYKEPHWSVGHTPWQRAPHLLEDVYTVADALVVATLLNSLVRHADRVRIACQAQLVNVIAPIMTAAGGPAWRQTIFYPFAYMARYGRGDALQVAVDCPGYDSKEVDDVPVLDVSATVDPESGELALFLVNRAQDDSVAVTADLRGFAVGHIEDHVVLRHDDVFAANTEQHQDRVRPARGQGAVVDDGRLRVELPALSWTMLRLSTTPAGRRSERSASRRGEAAASRRPALPAGYASATD